METVLQETPTLGKRDRDREHSTDVTESVPGWSEKIEVDVEHVLELDEQLHVEDKVVEGRADGALDRILDRDEGGIDLAALAASRASAIVAIATGLCVGQLRGIDQERLLAEGALGP